MSQQVAVYAEEPWFEDSGLRREVAQAILAAEDAREAAEGVADALRPAAGIWEHCSAPGGSWSLTYAKQILMKDPELRGKLAGRDGVQKMLEEMYRAGFTNWAGTHWVPNPPASKAGRVLVDKDGLIRITPAGLAILHQRLGGSPPSGPDQGA